MELGHRADTHYLSARAFLPGLSPAWVTLTCGSEGTGAQWNHSEQFSPMECSPILAMPQKKWQRFVPLRPSLTFFCLFAFCRETLGFRDTLAER